MEAQASAVRESRVWDRVGVVASTLCVIHCLVSPVVALLLPIVVATEGLTHRVLALAVVSFALLAFVPGYKQHREVTVLVLGVLGIGLIWTAVLLPETLGGETVETILTMSGGITMVAAHFRNIALCRRCRNCAPTQARPRIGMSAIGRRSDCRE